MITWSLRSGAPSRVLSAGLVALLFISCGCSGRSRLDGPDPVKSAKTIKLDLERGQRLMSEARADWDMADVNENLRGLSKLLKAEKLFFEARKLSPNSSKPRMALGNCRALIGYVYYSHYQKWNEQAKALEKERQPVPASVISERNKYLELSQDWLKKSNRELEFYVRFLMGQFPQPFIYEALATNYEYLEEYAAAESMIHAFINSVQLTRERRKYYEAKARYLRSKRLDSIEG